MRLIRSLLSLLLAAVILAAAFLVWKKLSADKLDTDGGASVEGGSQLTQTPVDMTPQITAENGGFTAVITEAQLAVLFEKAINECVPVRSVSVKISENGKISISCKVGATALTELLLAGGKPLPTTIETAIGLIGDTTGMDIALTAAMAVSEIALITDAFGVFGLAVGAGLMPDELVRALSVCINEYITQNVGNITEVATQDGFMTVKGKNTV